MRRVPTVESPSLRGGGSRRGNPEMATEARQPVTPLLPMGLLRAARNDGVICVSFTITHRADPASSQFRDVPPKPRHCEEGTARRGNP
jgi:hypothetical protein